MKIIENSYEVSEIIETLKEKGEIIGFVPTMGALHIGHLSLIENSIANNDITIASIFVNPTQFNNKNDLINYPRTLDNDFNLLRNFKCDIVFIPSEEEMYPVPDNRVFNFGNIGKVMEGRYREGHFNGVAKIVSKLFDIINPDRAYFGEKDFQQVAIIKELVRQLDLPVEIIPCPTIREDDGLAFSSRNKLLSVEDRSIVSVIPRTLFEAQKLSNKLSVEELKLWVINQINAVPFLEVEYFEIVDDKNLEQVQEWSENKNKIGCIAVKTREVRLIDNIKFYS